MFIIIIIIMSVFAWRTNGVALFDCVRPTVVGVTEGLNEYVCSDPHVLYIK